MSRVVWELSLVGVSVMFIFILAFYAKSTTSVFHILEPTDVELESLKTLNFKLENISITEITGYDHVQEVTLRKVEFQNILGITYLFENKTCSEGIRVIINFGKPQDWSRYDGFIVDVFGDSSDNTLQFWFFDAVSGKRYCIGSITLNWFGWKRLEFYLNPLIQRDSVAEFRIVILHNKNSVENVNYTIYITNPMFTENLKGKLDITQGGWSPYDKISVKVFKNKEMWIEYNFTSNKSKSVHVSRHFLLPQDLSNYDVLETLIYGDKSNNTIEFWYKDSLLQHGIYIGSIDVNWIGWKKIIFKLPKRIRKDVIKFKITIAYGQFTNSNTIIKGGKIKSTGTIIINDPIFKKAWHLDWFEKIVVTIFYISNFVVLYKYKKVSSGNPFIAVTTFLCITVLLYFIGLKLLANDFAEMAYLFILIGTFIKIVYQLKIN